MPPIEPSATYGEPSRPCAHSQMQATITAVITGSPEGAVAARSMRAQRSSRPSPRIARIVSPRPPRKSTAAIAQNRASDVSPVCRSPPLHWAAPITSPRKSVKTGRNHRVLPMRLQAAICMEDLLYRSLEETRESDGERQGGRVAPGLDGVDRLPGDVHLLRQIRL